MKIGERGQVTIPKPIRDQSGLGPGTEVEFQVVDGAITLHKAPRRSRWAEWKGAGAHTMAELGYQTADPFIEDIRGR